MRDSRARKHCIFMSLLAAGLILGACGLNAPDHSDVVSSSTHALCETTTDWSCDCFDDCQETYSTDTNQLYDRTWLKACKAGCQVTCKVTICDETPSDTGGGGAVTNSDPNGWINHSTGEDCDLTDENGESLVSGWEMTLSQCDTVEDMAGDIYWNVIAKNGKCTEEQKQPVLIAFHDYRLKCDCGRKYATDGNSFPDALCANIQCGEDVQEDFDTAKALVKSELNDAKESISQKLYAPNSDDIKLLLGNFQLSVALTKMTNEDWFDKGAWTNKVAYHLSESGLRAIVDIPAAAHSFESKIIEGDNPMVGYLKSFPGYKWGYAVDKIAASMTTNGLTTWNRRALMRETLTHLALEEWLNLVASPDLTESEFEKVVQYLRDSGALSCSSSDLI
jgi:hypothetical protein